MRYMIISYLRRANGQMDEVVAVTKNTKLRDIQTAAVILDFRRQQVVKCSLEGRVVPKDWNRIVGFYYQHYKNIMDRLASENGLEIKSQEPSVEENHPH
jgi:hypothetical protein